MKMSELLKLFSKNGINEPLRCSNTAPETSRSGVVLIKFASQW